MIPLEAQGECHSFAFMMEVWDVHPKFDNVLQMEPDSVETVSKVNLGYINRAILGISLYYLVETAVDKMPKQHGIECCNG